MPDIKHKLLVAIGLTMRGKGMDIGIPISIALCMEHFPCTKEAILYAFNSLKDGGMLYDYEETKGIMFCDVTLKRYYPYGIKRGWFTEETKPKILECYKGDYVKKLKIKSYVAETAGDSIRIKIKN